MADRSGDGYGRGAATQAAVAPGWQEIADGSFRHDPPTPYEFEAAIETVEDALMRARTAIPAASVLVASGAALREVAATAGAAGAVGAGPGTGIGLGLDAVEQIFQRLASASLGNPAAAHGLPVGKPFAATVLVLREVMHHLGFAAIVSDTSRAP